MSRIVNITLRLKEGILEDIAVHRPYMSSRDLIITFNKNVDFWIEEAVDVRSLFEKVMSSYDHLIAEERAKGEE